MNEENIDDENINEIKKMKVKKAGNSLIIRLDKKNFPNIKEGDVLSVLCSDNYKVNAFFKKMSKHISLSFQYMCSKLNKYTLIKNIDNFVLYEEIFTKLNIYEKQAEEYMENKKVELVKRMKSCAKEGHEDSFMNLFNCGNEYMKDGKEDKYDKLKNFWDKYFYHCNEDAISKKDVEKSKQRYQQKIKEHIIEKIKKDYPSLDNDMIDVLIYDLENEITHNIIIKSQKYLMSLLNED